jgi:hypothetical protein
MDAFRASSGAFFSDNCPRLFGCTFESISLSLLIADEAARDSLRKAELADSENHRGDALEHLAVCFAQVLHAYRHDPYARARYPYLRRLAGRDFEGISRELQSLVESLTKAVEQLQEEVTQLRMGLDPVRLAAFQRVVPEAVVAESGVCDTWRSDRGGEASAEDYQFCYNFVVESALRLQRLRLLPQPGK